jgi:hypothetical protein
MYFLKHIFLAAALTGSALAAAQGLSINNPNFSTNSDSIASGGNFFCTTSTFNNSLLSYNGTIDVYMYLDSMGTGGFAPANLHRIDSITIATNNFLPGDSVQTTSSAVLIIGNNCRGGINTVVIWPVASNMTIPTEDSLRHNVFVYDPTSLRTVEKGAIVIGPNPFSDRIEIISTAKNIVEQVRIMDMRGAVVYENNLPKKSWIETSALAQGVYYVEITFADGRKTIIKTIKQ